MNTSADTNGQTQRHRREVERQKTDRQTDREAEGIVGVPQEMQIEDEESQLPGSKETKTTSRQYLGLLDHIPFETFIVADYDHRSLPGNDSWRNTNDTFHAQLIFRSR